MDNQKTLSIIIPAYRASETIAATLQSVFEPSIPIANRNLVEVLVVDDGSPDRESLLHVLTAFPQVQLLTHSTNRGMCASRNSGIRASRGDIVTILDADDMFVQGWLGVLQLILNDWPSEVGVCFSACWNLKGQPTVSEPAFTGFLTFDDLLNERRYGEYLPLFRGDYIRKRRYVDLHMRRSCGIVSYLTLAQDGPFWVTNRVLRIYNDRRRGSVTRNWTDQASAYEMVRCYEALFARFAKAYAVKAPRVYRSKQLRYALYLKLAGKPDAWRVWARAANWQCAKETLGIFAMLLLGRSFTSWATDRAKKLGVVRRYG